jgi:hypothetical protein
MDVKASCKRLYSEILDTVTEEIKSRFPEDKEDIYTAIMACEPKSPDFLNYDIVKPLASKYCLDLSDLKSQLHHTNHILHQLNSSGNINEVHQVVRIVDEHGLFEVKRLLQLAMTIPVSTANPERSFSALRRVKTYLRSTMGQERLRGLAILYIERELSYKVNLDRVLAIFEKKSNRRIILS